MRRSLLVQTLAVVLSIGLVYLPDLARAQGTSATTAAPKTDKGAAPAPLPPPPTVAAPDVPAKAKPAAANTPAKDTKKTDEKKKVAPRPGPLASKADADLRKSYDHAFDLLLDGKWTNAIPILESISEKATDLELRGRADALLAYARAQVGRPANAPGRPPTTEPKKPASGRFAFVASSTIGGLAAGIEIDIAAAIQSVTPNVLIVMLTTGGAFTLSLLGTRSFPITEGEADLYSSGMLFGTYDALLIATMADQSGGSWATFALVGTVAGGGLGYLIAHALKMSAGDASLAGSGGLWGTVFGLLFLGLVEPTGTNSIQATLLTTSNLGAAVGIGIGFGVSLSRSRVLLMDLGGLLGGLAMGGIAAIAFANGNNPNGLRISSGMVLAGILGGGALSLHLTRNLDTGSGGGGGGGALFDVTDGHVRVGVPMPSIVPDLLHPGQIGLSFNLASGTLP